VIAEMPSSCPLVFRFSLFNFFLTRLEKVVVSSFAFSILLSKYPPVNSS